VINHIDVSSVLKTSVSEFYTNLVTRPTGVAVRSQIEQQLEQIGDHAVTILDFSHVGLMDLSCADEIVAKLLQHYVCAEPNTREVYFVFRGISESHRYAIETVLERHGLALVSQMSDGEAILVGTIDGTERQIWDAICKLGAAKADDLASETGMGRDAAESILYSLWKRRLLMRVERAYTPIFLFPLHES
jgi:hypothetical protein